MKYGCSRASCSSVAWKRGPVFGLLVLVGLVPEHGHGHAAQAQRGQADGFAGRVDGAEVGLAELGLGAELGELAARIVGSPGRSTRATPSHAIGNSSGDQRRQVRDLCDKTALVHLRHLTSPQQEEAR